MVRYSQLFKKRIPIRALGLAITLLFTGITGCVRMGTIVLPYQPQTIHIPIAVNKTYEYGVEERVTDVLVQEFIRDGRLKVVESDQADLLLQVTIDKYDLQTITVDDQEEAVVFRLDTRVLATLVDQRQEMVSVYKTRTAETGDSEQRQKLLSLGSLETDSWTSNKAEQREVVVYYQPDMPFSQNGVFFLSNQPQTRREEQIFVLLAEDMISKLLENW